MALKKTTLQIHACEPVSRANGPGCRFVVWFQGCSRGCAGCFNPHTHDPRGGTLWDIDCLIQDILQVRTRIEGISVSGGEPFQQPQACLQLLQRTTAAGLSTLVFTGYTLDEITGQPLGASLLRFIDVLIAGPFCRQKPAAEALLGSANQQIHFLTDRYRPEDLQNIPKTEIFIGKDGVVRTSGIKKINM